MNIKVLILTEGGQNIGFGHITRCTAIYQAFEEKGIIPTMVVNCDEVVKDLLKDINYIPLNWLKEEEKIFEIINKAEIVVIDSYLADLKFYKRVSSVVKTPVYLDDNMRVDYPEGIVVNGSIRAEELNYSKKRGVTYLLGAEYIPLRKEFWNVPEKTINKNVKNILISFGGINHSDLVCKIIDCLKGKFEFNLYVIESEKNRLSTSQVLNLMLRADICISGGGQTTYELARVGVPTIGICFYENQKWNLKGWKENGFIEYIGWADDANMLDKLEEALNKIISYEVRTKRSSRGKKYVDGKGAERIIINLEKIKSAEEKDSEISLRPVRLNDCYELWFWRSRPEVRRWSFDTEPIKYEKHKVWLARKLKNKKVKIYIAENKKGKKIGQVRFEINRKNSAYINVNLNPRFFGKGFGNKIIKVASEIFREKNPDIKELIAEIINENIISKRAFRKAGYIFSHNSFKKDKKINIFKMREIK